MIGLTTGNIRPNATVRTLDEPAPTITGGRLNKMVWEFQ